MRRISHCLRVTQRNLSTSSLLHSDKGDKDVTDWRKSGVGPMDERKDKTVMENPVHRTGKILKNDIKLLAHKVKRFAGFEETMSHDLQAQFFPTHVDICIIGGGAMGASIAYWLKKRAPHGFSVAVLEKDVTYAEASTVLSVGGLRQQFSLPENVEMSLFGAEFLRDIGDNCAVDGFMRPDVQFQPYGYLFLASQDGAQTLKENSEMQCKLGARNVLLSPEKLRQRFPWLDTSGVELGCLGLENEGWFDPWAYLNAIKQKSINYGAEYIQGEVIGFEYKLQTGIISPNQGKPYNQLERVIFKMPNGEIRAIKFGFCIIAAGPQSGQIAKMAKMGEEEGLLSVPLPIEPRKRYVYCYHCPDGPGIDTPLVVDPSGMYFRREGLAGCFIAGMSPSPKDEPPCDNLEVDYQFFDEKIWPLLAKRVPKFENLKMRSAWAGYYEYNAMDENGVIGYHPFYHNLLIASGFSGHGIQHSPAVGRAIMELLIDGEYKTIDLSRFSFERLCLGEPLNEKNIV